MHDSAAIHRRRAETQRSYRSRVRVESIHDLRLTSTPRRRARPQRERPHRGPDLPGTRQRPGLREQRRCRGLLRKQPAVGRLKTEIGRSTSFNNSKLIEACEDELPGHIPEIIEDAEIVEQEIIENTEGSTSARRSSTWSRSRTRLLGAHRPPSTPRTTSTSRTTAGTTHRQTRTPPLRTSRAAEGRSHGLSSARRPPPPSRGF